MTEEQIKLYNELLEELYPKLDETGPLAPADAMSLALYSALSSLKHAAGGQVFSEKEETFRRNLGKLTDRIEGFGEEKTDVP